MNNTEKITKIAQIIADNQSYKEHFKNISNITDWLREEHCIFEEVDIDRGNKKITVRNILKKNQDCVQPIFEKVTKQITTNPERENNTEENKLNFQGVENSTITINIASNNNSQTPNNQINKEEQDSSKEDPPVQSTPIPPKDNTFWDKQTIIALSAVLVALIVGIFAFIKDPDIEEKLDVHPSSDSTFLEASWKVKNVEKVLLKYGGKIDTFKGSMSNYKIALDSFKAGTELKVELEVTNWCFSENSICMAKIPEKKKQDSVIVAKEATNSVINTNTTIGTQINNSKGTIIIKQK